MELQIGQITTVFCNSCGQTRHEVLHMAKQRFEEDEDGHFEQNTYYTLQCCGCLSVKLRQDWYASWSGPGGEPMYFPPPSLRREPDWIGKWWMQSGMIKDNPTLSICREVYRALQNGQRHLAAMGVRAVLEQAMIDKIGGDLRGFDANLDELYRLGHVSALMRDRLGAVVDAGSATIHRGHTPTDADLGTLGDVMEHVIESLYIHEADVARMAQRTPPRPPRRAKPPKAAT